MKCSNCGYEHNEDYCPACGKSKITTIINYEELEAEKRNLAKNKKIVIFTCIAITLIFSSYIILNLIDNNSDKAVKVTTMQKLPSSSGRIGEYYINIKFAELTYNYNDELSLIVYYEFKNYSDKAQSFMYAVENKVYQDGVECGTTYKKYGRNIETDNQMLDIKPGVSLEVPILYKLNNNRSDIVVEVRPRIYFSGDTDLVTRTFTQ